MPHPPTPADLLTEGQQRHLRSSLARVAAALARIEALSQSSETPHPAALERTRPDLPPRFGDLVRDPLERARERVAALAAHFGLPAIHLSATSEVRALVVSSLVVLEDTTTRNLRGYGDIHPALPETLDPMLDGIHQEVRAIGDILVKGR
jgi:hypothetical protein